MNVVVDQGIPLYMEWEWQDAPDDAPIDYLLSKMVISQGDEDKYVLTLGTGLGISGVNGITKIQCDIVNTEKIPNGKYSYTIKILNDAGETELEDSGTIKVVKKSVDSNNYQPRPWDYFYPRLTQDVDEETATKRLKMCQSCDFFINDVCEKTFFKPSLIAGEKSAFCPIYKW